MNIQQVIAENLRRLRTERGLSLGQLAEEAGLSKVMLSQIEKGDSNPTINTIWKIAAGLGVPYTALLEQRDPAAKILSKEALEPQMDEAGHYRIYCYYPSAPHRDFEWFQLELDARNTYDSVGHPERAREYIFVWEGVLILETGGAQYRLGPEDSLTFDAAVRHTYRNDGPGMVKAAILNHYPG